MLKDKDKKRLDNLLVHFENCKGKMFGFPISEAGENDELVPFLRYVINNLGDPYSNEKARYGINTLEFEKEVIEWFGYLLHLRNPWGYVTSCGSEGNYAGLIAARKKYPEGVIYYSKSSHYSIRKAIDILGGWHVEIGVSDKEIPYYKELEDNLRGQYLKRPAIINVNIGTTTTGAIEEIDEILDILKKKGINRYYIHCDAALSGLILPVLNKFNLLSFRKKIDSVAISGHKLLGTAMPCGVFISRNKPITPFVEYLNSQSGPMFCSRNGLATLALWLAIKKLGTDGLEKTVNYCFDMVHYLEAKLLEIGWPYWKHDFSTIIVIKVPPKNIIENWQIATDGEYAHLICMPHVDKKMIDAFCADLVASTQPAAV